MAEELTMKVVRGSRERKRPADIWARFDQLQKRVRPLREGKHPKRGIYYGGERARAQRP